MKQRAASVAKVTVSVRALLNRFALLFLILAAFAIMLLGKADTFVVERARSSVVDIVAPVMDALSQPIGTVSEGADRASRFFGVYEANAQLREQNARLLEWQSAALGKADRIEKGDAVVNGEGLIGRVAEAGRRSGRVLLISDLNSRIPVVAEKSRIRAILAGDNSPSPKLAFLSPNARLDVGDRIVTSGHGGVFPSGLPVGRIASVADGVIRVEPFADFHRLEYVRIITEYPGEVAGQIIPSMARPSRKR